MHFKALLLLSTSVASLTIPKGQPNGVYVGYIADNGTEIHERVSVPSSHGQTKRQVDDPNNTPSTVYCYLGPTLNQKDTDTANANLDAQCGTGTPVPSSWHTYSISNTVIAYVCARGNATTCYASKRQQSSKIITAKCGLYGSGQVNDETAAYGYHGFTDRICGADHL